MPPKVLPAPVDVIEEIAASALEVSEEVQNYITTLEEMVANQQVAVTAPSDFKFTEAPAIAWANMYAEISRTGDAGKITHLMKLNVTVRDNNEINAIERLRGVRDYLNESFAPMEWQFYSPWEARHDAKAKAPVAPAAQPNVRPTGPVAPGKPAVAGPQPPAASTGNGNVWYPVHGLEKAVTKTGQPYVRALSNPPYHKFGFSAWLDSSDMDPAMAEYAAGDDWPIGTRFTPDQLSEYFPDVYFVKVDLEKKKVVEWANEI